MNDVQIKTQTEETGGEETPEGKEDQGTTGTGRIHNCRSCHNRRTGKGEEEMSKKTKTKKCPFCRYLITSDRISCAYCGTISPTLWEERITDDWEKEIDRHSLIRQLSSSSYKHGRPNYTYRDLYKAASNRDKVFISKVAIETHQHDLEIYFDTFVQLKKTYDAYEDRDGATPSMKEECKLFVFKIGNLYRYVGHDSGTITLFEISTELHDLVMNRIKDDEAEIRRLNRVRTAEYETERKKKAQAIMDEYNVSLAEYNALPYWKRKLTKEPEIKERRGW